MINRKFITIIKCTFNSKKQTQSKGQLSRSQHQATELATAILRPHTLMLSSHKWPELGSSIVSPVSPTAVAYLFLLSSMQVTCKASTSSLISLPNIWCSVRSVKLLTTQSCAASDYIVLVRSNILVSSLTSNFRKPYSSLKAGDQVSRPYRTANGTIFSYNLF